MYLITHDKNTCCGCTACEQICGHGAITMEADEDGFVYPVKNLSLCTGCGLCEKVCPYEHLDGAGSGNSKVYAAYVKDKAEREKSSSGGLFYIIAKHVLENGGVVYGASLTSQMKNVHMRVDSLEDLGPLRGSKYVQSDLRNTYREIRSLLREGRIVYFTGTGCQVAGLKSFLIKEYPTLITSDLVCHGVPSQKFFSEHIAYLEEKYHGKVVDYRFRDNKSWEGCELVEVKHSSGKCRTYILPSYFLSPYLYAFMNAMVDRDSCYSCPFAAVPRQGDITLADFWGIKKSHPELDASAGVSLVLVNSQKGIEVWDAVKKELKSEMSDIVSAARENKNLIVHTERPEIRSRIFDLIRTEGYARVARTIFRPKNYHTLLMTAKIREWIGADNYKKIRKIIRRLR